MLSRRQFAHHLLGAGSALCALPEPVEALAKAVKPIRIAGVDVFRMRIPISQEEQRMGKDHEYVVGRIDTDAGHSGYCFAGPNPQLLESHIRPALLGKDLFAVDEHLRNGLMEWNGLEHAVWDAIGKIAGRPVYELLGGARKTRMPLYLTTVWIGNPDQSQVSFDEQAAVAAKFKQAGFRGMKIRAWRPNPMDDVEACRVIREAVGPDFSILFDRTGEQPRQAGQQVWDYPTALRVARGLEQHGAYWLEEPFARNDFVTPARLRRDASIPVTGGEAFLGLDPFREALVQGSYDVLNPESRRSGGILTCCRVAWMAEAFRIPCVCHGTNGLRLAGCLHTNAVIGSQWQELVTMRPPLLPEEQWDPALQVVNSPRLYAVENGEIEVPALPGIGLDLNEEAVERFRVAA